MAENSSPKVFYHLIQSKIWEKCKADNETYYPPTYDQDGFTHLTEDASLLIEVGNQFYKSVQGTWILLQLDCTQTESEVKIEPAAAVGDIEGNLKDENGDDLLFPHLYGGIVSKMVVK